ncbi:MAG: DUF4437 domain-containing protein [Myxococcales bacterium]|nr:DUF4437 domain-containing protein [Myxococcales bacterium]
MRRFLSALVLVGATLAGAQAAAQGIDSTPESESSVILVSKPDVEWSPLNPARGSRGPEAGALWGDRTASGPSGFLVRFAEGFSSPPHIHNITYRGVVISGLIHNDDPTAKEMWMPTGSFWTQPAGEVHITAAQGKSNLAYIEIAEGPYLVLPGEQAFDRGERPINVDPSNHVWLDSSDLAWIDRREASDVGPAVAFLWGSPQPGQLNGALVKLPTGFTGTMRSRGSTFRAVAIEGRVQLHAPGEADPTTLEPGSYFGSKGQSVHRVSCEVEGPCILYVRAEGELEVGPALPEAAGR